MSTETSEKAKTTLNQHQMKFEIISNSTDPKTFFVSNFTFTEAISTPYQLKIDLISSDPDVEIDKQLNTLATFKLKIRGVIREFHGGGGCKHSRRTNVSIKTDANLNLEEKGEVNIKGVVVNLN
ncbi:MAG: hypothetical protein OEX00_12015 [Gammaproteobacteria bacterium]|nr:hypothetical protein [Gammaproteobacteria bacterium]MDH5693400.1 hypothetical protein [Gammaproteobacteria bacterium]